MILVFLFHFFFFIFSFSFFFFIFFFFFFPTHTLSLSPSLTLAQHIELDALASPHLDVDLGASSKLDNLDFFVSGGGADVRSDANRTELSPDATLDVFAKDLPAGRYQLGILAKNALGGAFVRFSVGYDLNGDAGAARDFPLAACPAADCAAPERQSCARCTAGALKCGKQ